MIALDVQWQANGAWGERRYQQWNGPLDNLLIPTSTARGFTDHEHLDAVGLIHMNGRVYDPELGRFMSADPFVQAPFNSQSYNRYSYVFNNPLSNVDPAGYNCGRVDIYDEHGKPIRSDSGSGGMTLCGQDAENFIFDWDNATTRAGYVFGSVVIPDHARMIMEFNSAAFGLPNTMDIIDAKATESAQELNGELSAAGFKTTASVLSVVVLTYGKKKNEQRNTDSLSKEERLLQSAVGKGNNVTVKTQKEAEQLLEKIKPDIPWSLTYGPKAKVSKEIHPVDGSGNAPGFDYELPHIKWRDWTGGKGSGAEGHIYFESVNGKF